VLWDWSIASSPRLYQVLTLYSVPGWNKNRFLFDLDAMGLMNAAMLFASDETSPGSHGERGTPERFKDAVWTVQKIPM
jgi:hypothetical protein